MAGPSFSFLEAFFVPSCAVERVSMDGVKEMYEVIEGGSREGGKLRKRDQLRGPNRISLGAEKGGGPKFLRKFEDSLQPTPAIS